MGRLVLGLFVCSCVIATGAVAGKLPFTASQARGYVKAMENDIAEERSAIALIGKDDELAAGKLDSVSFRLNASVHALGNYAIPGRSPLPDLSAAETLDAQAAAALKQKTKAGEKTALAHVAAALVHKKNAQSLFETAETLAPGRRCEVTKPFPVYAVPEGFAASTNDVFPHGVPPNPKDIKVSFIDLATGKPPAGEVFPGQTWSFDVKGLAPGDKFDVAVNVVGTGFGKPDANAKHWKVVVSFDCS